MAFPTKGPFKIGKRSIQIPFYESISASGDLYRLVKSAKYMEMLDVSWRFFSYSDVTDLEAHLVANVANSFSLTLPVNGSGGGVSYTLWYDGGEISVDDTQPNRWEVTVSFKAVKS